MLFCCQEGVSTIQNNNKRKQLKSAYTCAAAKLLEVLARRMIRCLVKRSFHQSLPHCELAADGNPEAGLVSLLGATTPSTLRRDSACLRKTNESSAKVGQLRSAYVFKPLRLERPIWVWHLQYCDSTLR